MSRADRICCDPRTKRWFRERWSVETTLVKCEACGLYYKPSLGHKCKMDGTHDVFRKVEK